MHAALRQDLGAERHGMAGGDAMRNIHGKLL